MARIQLNPDQPDYTSYDERDSGGITGGALPKMPTADPSYDAGTGGIATNPGKPIDTYPTPTQWQPPPQPGQQWDPNVASFIPSNIPIDPTGYVMGPNGTLIGRSGSQGSASPAGRTDQNYILGKIAEWSKQPGSNASLANDPNYWLRRIMETGGLGSDNESYWQQLGMRPEGAPENWTPSMGSNPSNWNFNTPGNWGGGTNVFNDPATQQYEQLLNSLVGNLNKSFTPPSFGPAMDYLTKYFQQLQGPAYTPEQMDLMQTQSFDPIMQQRDAARKALTERYAARGTGSGPLEQALLNSDQAYERLGTQARAGVANNAIGMQKNQQAQAAQLGPLMAGLEQQQFGNNENRQLQAAQLASIVPSLAWSRLQGAGAGIQPLNPSALLGQQNQFQQQGYQQGAGFSNQLFQAIAKILGIG